jgi:hypothetical protein
MEASIVLARAGALGNANDAPVLDKFVIGPIDINKIFRLHKET